MQEVCIILPQFYVEEAHNVASKSMFEVAVAAVLIGQSVDVRLLSDAFHLLLLCAVKQSVSWGITIG